MKPLAMLEYRLNDKKNLYPIIYRYHHMEKTEIFCRRICDLFIKDQKIYQKTACSRNEDIYIMYVNEFNEEGDKNIYKFAPVYNGINIEIRSFNEESSPLITTFEMNSHEEALEWLGNDYIKVDKNEYKKKVVEIDEDRSTYVLYVIANSNAS